jgi:DNA-binding GntR family transcriptional regulator
MRSKSKGMSELKPVESSSLHEKVYSQLRRGLMAGRFRPGETLTLRALAAALGTSVMPARDAVLRLSGERALEPQGRGVRVPVLDEQQFNDVLKFRISLEGEACALAAHRATREEIDEASAAADHAERMCASGNLDRFLVANQEFHFAVYRGAHSALLQSLIETLWLQIGPYLAKLAEGSSASDCRAIDLSAHRKLVSALKRRDAEAAREALRADLSDRDELFVPLQASATPAQPLRKLRARARGA